VYLSAGVPGITRVVLSKLATATPSQIESGVGVEELGGADCSEPAGAVGLA